MHIAMEKTHGNLTEAEYNKLVKQHGKLTCIVVDEETDNPIYLWFKKPDMKTLSAAARFSDSDPVQSASIFFKNCLVHGDAALSDDVDVFSGVAPLLQQLVQKRSASIKNF